MATVVNNPGGNNGGGAAGWIVGLVVLILVILAAIFILPRLANTQGTGTAAGAAATGQTGTGADNSGIPPVTNNTYNTTINASTTIPGGTGSSTAQ